MKAKRSPLSALLFTMTCLLVIGAFLDSRENSVAFMERPGLELERDLGAGNRFVASRKNVPVLQYIEFNQSNIDRFSGPWEITKIVNYKGEVVFDHYNRKQDKKSELIVNFKMVGTSKVIMDGDANQIYSISLATKFDKVTLFKFVDSKFEIVEAQRFVPPVKIESKNKVVIQKIVKHSPVTDDGVEEDKGVKYKEGTYILERALNPGKSKKALFGDNVSGSFVLNGSTIESLRINLAFPNGEAQDLPEDYPYIEVKHGSFQAGDGEDMVSGVFTNHKNGYRIRFVTGPLQGTSLNFVHERDYEQIIAARERVEAEKTEEQKAIEQEAQEVATNTSNLRRSEQAQKKVESYDEEDYSDEEYYGDEEKTDSRRKLSSDDEEAYDEEYDEEVQSEETQKEDTTSQAPTLEEMKLVVQQKGFKF